MIGIPKSVDMMPCETKLPSMYKPFFSVICAWNALSGSAVKKRFPPGATGVSLAEVNCLSLLKKSFME